MRNEPAYEIWGSDDFSSEVTGDVFREDCMSLEEARKALPDWQTAGRSAFIRDKETGKVVR